MLFQGLREGNSEGGGGVAPTASLLLRQLQAATHLHMVTRVAQFVSVMEVGKRIPIFWVGKLRLQEGL
jgi:hypothetical protein